MGVTHEFSFFVEDWKSLWKSDGADTMKKNDQNQISNENTVAFFENSHVHDQRDGEV